MAVAVVDPLECCASSDAPTVPDAVWLPAVADFAGTFAADVDSVPFPDSVLFSDFEASAVVATLAAEELAAEDVVFSAELATLPLS